MRAAVQRMRPPSAAPALAAALAPFAAVAASAEVFCCQQCSACLTRPGVSALRKGAAKGGAGALRVLKALLVESHLLREVVALRGCIGRCTGGGRASPSFLRSGSSPRTAL